MIIFPGDVLVLDTETTGLPRDVWAMPVELGAVLLDAEGVEVGSYQCLIRPPVFDGRADPALRINGIPRHQILSDGVAPVYALQGLRGWLRGVAQAGVAEVFAFNMPFDAGMLKRIGIDLEAIAPCRCIKAEGIEAGVVGRLSEIAARWGLLDGAQPHRALPDARLAARVLVALRRAQGEAARQAGAVEPVEPVEPVEQPVGRAMGQQLSMFGGGV